VGHPPGRLAQDGGRHAAPPTLEAGIDQTDNSLGESRTALGWAVRVGAREQLALREPCLVLGKAGCGLEGDTHMGAERAVERGDGKSRLP
jgi:hypothetical protein